MKRTALLALALLLGSIAATPVAEAGSKCASRCGCEYLCAARGTICAKDAVPTITLGENEVTFAVKEGNVNLFNDKVTVTVTNVTADLQAAGTIPAGDQVALQVSFPFDVVWPGTFCTIPSVQVTGQASNDGSFILPQGLGAIMNANFVVQGAPSATGFTSSTIVIVVGPSVDGLLAATQGLLQAFCLHVHGSTEKPCK